MRKIDYIFEFSASKYIDFDIRSKNSKIAQACQTIIIVRQKHAGQETKSDSIGIYILYTYITIFNIFFFYCLIQQVFMYINNSTSCLFYLQFIVYLYIVVNQYCFQPFFFPILRVELSRFADKKHFINCVEFYQNYTMLKIILINKLCTLYTLDKKKKNIHNPYIIGKP